MYCFHVFMFISIPDVKHISIYKEVMEKNVNNRQNLIKGIYHFYGKKRITCLFIYFFFLLTAIFITSMITFRFK